MQRGESSQGKSIRWNPRPSECSGWDRDSHVMVSHDNIILIVLIREWSRGKAKEPSPSHKYTQSFSLEKQEATRLELSLPHPRPPWEGKPQAKAKGAGSLPRTGAGRANPHSLMGGWAHKAGALGAEGLGANYITSLSLSFLHLQIQLSHTMQRDSEKCSQAKRSKAPGTVFGVEGNSEDVSFLQPLPLSLQLFPWTNDGNYQVGFFMHVSPSYKAGIKLLRARK